MVEIWTLCIKVSCYPNPRQAMITFVQCNIEMNNVLQRKRNVPGRTTNNEAYYIALIEYLWTTKEYGSNGIVVFTNSVLVCNQMKGVYQVKKERLKKLHREEKNIVSQFQSFSIRHCENVNMMSSDLLYGAMQIQYLCVNDKLALRRSPSKFTDGHCKISLMWVCFLVLNVVFLMTMCFFNAILSVPPLCKHNLVNLTCFRKNCI